MADPSLSSLPSDLPVPRDDGAADHLMDLALVSIPLPSTSGRRVDLGASRETTVVYVYPHTGRPDIPTPKEWDLIPGARGCTPQACAFRDHHAELRALGAHVYGVSTDTVEWQREAAERLHLPFELLNDADRSWSNALRLPAFEFQGRVFLKRVTLILETNRVKKVFYPIFPPDRNAADVIAFLGAGRRGRR